MRAALLPAAGNAQIATYWCNAYRNVWRGEVDELLVLVNGDAAAVPVYQAVGARVLFDPARLNHGDAIGTLLAETHADTVVLIEDDAFVRQPGQIAARLEAIESGRAEVIGCPRGGMDPAIAAAAETKWGPIIGPDTSCGHGLWPCFLFARADTLRAAAPFASRSWGPGETIPGLGYTCPSVMTTDTMSAAAFILRDRYRITLDVQYKELWQKTCSGTEPWLHVGGLSTDPASIRADIGMDNLEGRDWAHRFWWWRRMGLDYSAYAAHAKVDPDWWTDTLLPWITWE